jgi:hypothetical protein
MSPFSKLARQMQSIGQPAAERFDTQVQGVSAMFKSDIVRTVSAIACTLVMSATCLIGAVGPAQAGAGKAAVAATTRLVA